MPRNTPRISQREQRGAEFQQFQEGSQRQQQINTQSQAAMMQQLAGLLGIQQDQQMNPAKLAALQADTASKQFELQHAPELLASKLGADKAQQDYYGARSGGQITPKDFMDYQMHTGTPHPSDPRVLAETQKKDAERAQMVAAEEARMGQAHVPPEYVQSSPSQVGQHLGQDISTGLYNMPSSIYNLAAGGADFLTGLLGLPLHSSHMRPLGDTIAAARQGKFYNNQMFYDPQNVEDRYPLPQAKERRK